MMWVKLYGIIYYGVENRIFKFRTCGKYRGGYYMYILLWKNKRGNITATRTIRDKNRKEIFDNIKRLERGEKYLTIIHCDEYEIIYNSGAGWINDK